MGMIAGEEVADALAATFQDEMKISALMARAGIDMAKLPRLGMNAPADYWVYVLQQLKIGDGGDGALQRLLAAAADRVPGNRELEAAALEFSPGWSPQEERLVRDIVASNSRDQLRELVERAVVRVLAAGAGQAPTASIVDGLKRAATERLVEADDLESVWNDVSYQPVAWLSTALERSGCVARIGHSLQSGVGTGFRLPSSWLGRSDDASLLLTNAHVISEDPEVREQCRARGVTSLEPDEAHVTFFGLRGQPLAEGYVRRVLWSSAPDALDATVVELDFDATAIPIVPRYQAELAKVDRLNVIGHPHGRDKQFSLQDNRVDHQRSTPDRIYYSSPTDPGSSGSPLFDNETWSVVGLHHASDADNRLNKGIVLSAILSAIESARERNSTGGSTDA